MSSKLVIQGGQIVLGKAPAVSDPIVTVGYTNYKFGPEYGVLGLYHTYDNPSEWVDPGDITPDTFEFTTGSFAVDTIQYFETSSDPFSLIILDTANDSVRDLFTSFTLGGQTYLQTQATFSSTADYKLWRWDDFYAPTNPMSETIGTTHPLTWVM